MKISHNNEKETYSLMGGAISLKRGVKYFFHSCLRNCHRKALVEAYASLLFQYIHTRVFGKLEVRVQRAARLQSNISFLNDKTHVNYFRNNFE